MVWLRFLRKVSFLRMRTLGYASLIFVFGVAGIMYALEPETFGSYFRAVYWTMTTVVTVGYGDFFPNTDTRSDSDDLRLHLRDRDRRWINLKTGRWSSVDS
ncbi:potassium channel family protein [Exiguobacterium sp. SL14]|nr:potassium channel family protein [Exiguobacterium sp. SL14]MCY1691526.1 potassium channel family protein [Exiguobacterium sp. SL14]